MKQSSNPTLQALVSLALASGCSAALPVGQEFSKANPGDGGESCMLLAVSLNRLDFGSVPIGSGRGTLTVQLRNSGSGTCTLAIGSLPFPFQGPFADGLADGGHALALAAGQSLSLTVAFAPIAVGTYSSTFTVADLDDQLAGDSDQVVVAVSGIGIGGVADHAPCQLAAVPATLNFGAVAIGGGPGSLTVQVVNQGGSVCTIAEIGKLSAPFQGPFSDRLPDGGPGFGGPGLALEPGSSLSLAAAFAPTAAGQFHAVFGILTTVPSQGGGPRSLEIPADGEGVGKIAGDGG